MTPRAAPGEVLQWLLAGDPAIRWQVQRDLLGASAAVVRRERRTVAEEGWGAQLLARQDAAGTWGGGLYNPKWTSTTYTLLMLRDFGLAQDNAQARRGCSILLERGMRADGGVNLVPSHRSETCVTGMTLALASYFTVDDDRLDTILDHLLDRQMADGGWNCRYPGGATHASVNTTITVLEALRQYEQFRRRRQRDVRAAQERGREFLLVHRLFRSHRTGRVIKTEFTRLAFPPRWHYDILRALDYFRAVDAPRDSRLADAIHVLNGKVRPDGRWPLEHEHKGKSYFRLERVKQPSRWNTLRALRVLKWWNP
jgi:hypothetical protein